MNTKEPFREIDDKVKGIVPIHRSKMIAKLIDVNETGFSCLKQACEVMIYPAKDWDESIINYSVCLEIYHHHIRVYSIHKGTEPSRTAFKFTN